MELTFKAAWLEKLVEPVPYYQKLSNAQGLHKERHLSKTNILNTAKLFKGMEFLVWDSWYAFEPHPPSHLIFWHNGETHGVILPL